MMAETRKGRINADDIETLIDTTIRERVAPEADSGLDIEDLKSRALGRAENIRATTADLRQKVDQARRLVESRSRRGGAWWLALRSRPLRAMLVVVGGVAGIAALLGVLELIVGDISLSFQGFDSVPTPSATVAALLSVLAIAVFRTAWWLAASGSANPADALAEAKREEAAAREELETVMGREISQTVSSLVDEMAPSWKLELSGRSRNQLAEIYNSDLAVQTEAEEELRARLALMPGGSVGLAGSRGAGKTTLIRRYCERPPSLAPAAGVVRVMVSAPVRYETSDFVVHLFSQLCRVVLGEDEFRDAQRPDRLLLSRQPMSHSARMTVRYAIGLATVLGMLFLAMAWGSGRDAYVAAYGETPAATAETASQDDPSEGTNEDDRKQSKGLDWFVLLSRVGHVLGLTPLQALIAGLILCVSSWIGWSVFSQRNRNSLGLLAPDRESVLDTELRHNVQMWAAQLAFQQTFTAGWSSKLSTPVGLEGGLTGGRSLARRPLTLPEIVEGYRDIVRRIVGATPPELRGDSPGVVMIGIDELDKIDDLARVQAFLNDMKALFGVEGCFYLIAVSENAMSNFERRGLPFRDAFDSALDDVLRVQQISLQGSIRLIGRRVVGLPRPFLMLCHCLSGGLPRDLIRICRKLLKDAGAQEESAETLGQAAVRLVSEDAAGRLRGCKLAALERSDDPMSADLVVLLGQIDAQLDAAGPDAIAVDQALLDGATALRRQALDRANAANGDAEPAEREPTMRACSELLAYFAFSATVLALFGSATDVRALKAAAEPGDLADRLARARDAFADGAETALARINAVREAMPRLAAIPGVDRPPLATIPNTAYVLRPG